MKLAREVRMALVPASDEPVLNSWGGWPATDQLVPMVAVRLSVRGPLSVETGMICDIKALDRLVRQNLPQVEPRGMRAAPYLQSLWDRLRSVAGPVELAQLEIALTPQLRFQIDQKDPTMVTLTHQFEFSAAHRLHCDHLSDEENRELFGKCNYPNGHGHNYVLEVAITGPLSGSGEVFPLHALQSICKEQIVDRYDHKHLNKDCPEFAERNPTVEHIAQQCWQLLEGKFAPAQLTRLRLYETPKTWVELTRESSTSTR